MTPAELRALPIVIHERRHHRHLSDPAFNDLLVTPALSCSPNMNVCTGLAVGLPEPFKGCPLLSTSAGTTATSAARLSMTFLVPPVSGRSANTHVCTVHCIGLPEALKGSESIFAAQDMEEVAPSSGSSTSNCSSPRGPKGGGTLKTCAVCIEDYRQGCHAGCEMHSHHNAMCLPLVMSTG